MNAYKFQAEVVVLKRRGDAPQTFAVLRVLDPVAWESQASKSSCVMPDVSKTVTKVTKIFQEMGYLVTANVPPVGASGAPYWNVVVTSSSTFQHDPGSTSLNKAAKRMALNLCKWVEEACNECGELEFYGSNVEVR